MQDTRKKNGEQKGAAVGERAGQTQMGDATSAKLAKMTDSIGNDEIQRRLDQGNATRDELLQFLSQRLTTIRDVQLREIEQCQGNNPRTWWMKVSDSQKEDVTKPEPMRWKDSAALYEDACFQLCRGALGRGAELMRRALDAERKTFGTLTSLVNTKDLESEPSGPTSMHPILPEEACGPCDTPTELKLAQQIQDVNTEPKDPMNRKRKKDPWWTLEEEEEEEEDGSGQ
jgi:hypothetical protein